MEIQVLVVDDDSEIRRLVQLSLARERIDVAEAGSVDEMMEYLAAGTIPDVIFLDLRLPGRNGWYGLDLLKKDTSYAQIPVVVFTGHDDPDFRRTAKTRGAADFIAKPFRPWDLVDAVQRCVRRERGIDPWLK